MPIFFDRARGRYKFQFRRVVNGRRLSFARLLPKGWNRDQAERYDQTETARLYALASGIDSRQPLIAEAVQVYLEHRVPDLRYSKGTAQALANMLPWYEGQTLAELPDVARRYRADNAELAPATIRNRLAYLRAACHYAWQHHQLGDQDYSRRVAMPTVRNARQVYLRPADLQRLLKACRDDELRALVRLAYWTGLRWVAELLPRESTDVIRDGADVWIAVPDSKAGRPHMVWVHPDARSALEHLPFSLHWRTYYTRFRAACAIAGLDHVHMHDLRHSLASALISNGATLAEVGGVLNHSTAQATNRYAHLYPERAAAVVGKLGNLSKGRRTA